MPEKLVRDFIPEMNPGKPFRQCAHNEDKFYFEKLREEVEEFIANPCLEELADIEEILWFVRAIVKVTEKDVRECQKKKNAFKGSFNRGYIMDFEK